MASGHKPKAPRFYAGDINYTGFVRGVRREGDRDKHGSVKVLMQNGAALESPKIIPQTAKGDLAAKLRMASPRSETLILDGMTALGFEHSVVVYGYIADFFHPKLRLVVEIDGPHHLMRKAYDRHRDLVLERLGIATFRIPASEVYGNPSGIVERVAVLMAAKAA